MATPIPNGAMARTIRDITTHDRDYSQGAQFVVNDYVSASEAANGKPFYWGNINDGINNITVLAEDCEMVMTAEQVNGRRVPTSEAVLDALVEGLGCVDGEGFSIDSADTDTRNKTIEFSGRTSEGLPFGFTVQLTSLGEIS